MMKSFALNEHALMLSAVFSHSVSVVRFQLFFFLEGENGTVETKFLMQFFVRKRVVLKK